MTVCIAAIYEYGQVDQGVVVVADRRYVDSPSGLAFESPYPKIFSLASHVVGLVADDMDLQSELMRTTTIALAKKQDVTVEDGVDCYI